MKHAMLSALILAVTGCVSATIPAYTVSASNVATLRRIGHTVNVGKFVSTNPTGRLSVICGAKVYVPNKWTFAAYIQHAIKDELQMADLFSVSAPIKLTGVLEDVDFSMHSNVWQIELVVTSSNDTSVRVEIKHKYLSGDDIITACFPTAQAFVPAVQQLLGKIYTSPEFKALVSPKKVAKQ